MSKCHVRELSQVFEAILKDASDAYPTLRTEFERDLSRLQSLVRHRGIRVYLVDLVAIGRHLDRCLSDGEYKLSGLPLTKRFSGRVVIPKFLRGLYLLVFHETGRLRDDADPEAVFFLRQILLVAKKYKLPCTSDKVYDAVVDFVEVDKELPEPEGYWSVPASSFSSREHPYEGFVRSHLLKERVDAVECSRERCDISLALKNLDVVSGIFTSVLGPYRPGDWKFRHGPGAISEVIGASNKYHWHCWPETLESEFPIADYGYHSYSSWAGPLVSNRSGFVNLPNEDKIPISRLVDVPKTYSGPRLIAAEPSSHQWCQQNLWHYFCTRVQNTWLGKFISFRDQRPNQALCRRGSRGYPIATVDLSSASDRVTCHVVGQFFRGNPRLLSSLRASRTHVVGQTLVDSLPEQIQLRKFSTMGSACTFPVETLLFLGISVACALVTRGQRPNVRNIRRLAGEVAVFGDDIVVPSDCRGLLEAVLEVLYFKINSHKSHWTGRFRESCGLDAFDGVDVTPVYWRQSNNGKPESVASTVMCRNNFYQKWLLHTASLLASTLPQGIPWVANGSGVFGLKTRCKFRNDGFKHRHNPDLQCVEIRLLSLIAKQTKSRVRDDSAIFQYFTEEPSPYDLWAAGVPQRPKSKLRFRWVDESLITSS